MTLRRALLRDLAVAALKKAATPAQERVYSVFDTPTWDGEYPMIIVRSPQERKESLGRAGAPQFTATATLQVMARLCAATDDAAEAALEVLAEAIERALINSYDLTRHLQQFSFVETAIDFSAEGDAHLAQLTVNFGLEFYQGPEDFAPIEAKDLKEIDLAFQNAANGKILATALIAIPQEEP